MSEPAKASIVSQGPLPVITVVTPSAVDTSDRWSAAADTSTWGAVSKVRQLAGSLLKAARRIDSF